MTKNQVEVITSVQRRRRWLISEKERIIAAALEPGAVAFEVARAAGIHVSQLFRWRQQLCAAERTAPTFSPVAVVPGPGAAPALARTMDSIKIDPVEYVGLFRAPIFGKLPSATGAFISIACVTGTAPRRSAPSRSRAQRRILSWRNVRGSEADGWPSASPMSEIVR